MYVYKKINCLFLLISVFAGENKSFSHYFFQEAKLSLLLVNDRPCIMVELLGLVEMRPTQNSLLTHGHKECLCYSYYNGNNILFLILEATYKSNIESKYLAYRILDAWQLLSFFPHRNNY